MINTIPIGVTANKEKLSMGWVPAVSDRFDDSMRSFSRIKGLDPTIVTVPPKIAQNPIGMSSRDIGRLPLRAILDTTGRKSAAAPMFCMKLEMHPTDAEMIVMTRPSVRPPNFKILPAAWLMIPVLSRPAPIIITAIMAITALLEKPSKRYSSGTRPA